jgi:chemotaxis protein MotD
MNLPANFPVIASSGSGARADRSAPDEAAATKFGDMIAPKSGQGAQKSANQHADDRKTTWSWTRIELPNSRIEWSRDADAEPTDLADDETVGASVENTDEPAEDVETHGQWSPDGKRTVEAGNEAETGERAELPPAIETEPEAAPPEEGKDETAEERDPLAAQSMVTAGAQSPLPVQGDGESRQGAVAAAGEDRRLVPRLVARERSSAIGERTVQGAERAETTMREAGRPAMADGERLSQRGGAEGDSRPAEARLAVQSRADQAQKRDDQVRPDPFAQRVTVVASQTTPVMPPAPALTSVGLSSASTQVVTAIREDVGEASRAALASIEAQEANGARNRPVHTLQIQLQPADLGRVNARMSLEGTQLRVELQVETEQARAALSRDADSILKALKAAGFEIDRVTIQQAQPAANTAPTGNQDRGAASFAAQGNGADESGSQGNQRGTGHQTGHAPQEGHDGASQHDTRGGLFI